MSSVSQSVCQVLWIIFPPTSYVRSKVIKRCGSLGGWSQIAELGGGAGAGPFPDIPRPTAVREGAYTRSFTVPYIRSVGGGGERMR